jgi:hypothetical protein
MQLRVLIGLFVRLHIGERQYEHGKILPAYRGEPLEYSIGTLPSIFFLGFARLR